MTFKQRLIKTERRAGAGSRALAAMVVMLALAGTAACGGATGATSAQGGAQTGSAAGATAGSGGATASGSTNGMASEGASGSASTSGGASASSESAAGTGSGSASTGGASGTTPSSVVKDIFTANGVQDIIARFKVLQYKYTYLQDASTTTEAKFVDEGMEQVAGTTADKISVSFSEDGQQSQTFVMWIDKQGKTVKLSINGHDMPTSMATQVTKSMLMAAFAPFAAVSEQDFTSVWSEDGSGVRSHTVTTEKIAGHSVKVHTFKTSVTTGQMTGDYTWRFADFGSFQVLIEWTSKVNGKTTGTRLTIEKLELH